MLKFIYMTVDKYDSMALRNEFSETVTKLQWYCLNWRRQNAPESFIKSMPKSVLQLHLIWKQVWELCLKMMKLKRHLCSALAIYLWENYL